MHAACKECTSEKLQWGVRARFLALAWFLIGGAGADGAGVERGLRVVAPSGG